MSEAQKRKATPIYSGVVRYFPKAMRYLAMISQAGNDQHNPGSPLHWDRAKSGDEQDALMRHLTDHADGILKDTDGILHLGKVAWRGMSGLEKLLEELDEQNNTTIMGTGGEHSDPPEDTTTPYITRGEI